MCQVDDGDLFMRKDVPRARKAESRDECVKCSSADVVIPHGGHAALCRACFLANVNHKFRATVAKSQALRQGELVLLAYSGGVASGSMLSFVAEGVKEGTTKKLRFRPGAILHVDESAAMTPSTIDDDGSLSTEGAEDNRRRETIESLGKNVMTIFGGCDNNAESSTESVSLPSYVAPLENAMAIGEETDSTAINGSVDSGERRSDVVCDVGDRLGIDNYLDMKRKKTTIENRRRLSTFLGNLQSSTSKIRAVQLLRRKLISHLSKMLGFVHVMEGVSASRVAIDIMTDLALGRGTQIPKDVGLVDDRFYASDGVTVVRPLREFSDKEIVVYCNLSKVPTLVTENMETGASPLSSIQRATENFILGLQTDFSSTVSTVCKTGEKLAGNKLKSGDAPSMETAERCCLCNTILDVAEATLNDVELMRQITSSPEEVHSVGNCHATAARALDVTTVISRAASDAETSSIEQSDHHSDLSAHQIAPPAITRSLCYSCRLISREINDHGKCKNADTSKSTSPAGLDHFPSFVVRQALRKDDESALRNEIKDFLLDDT